jgi:GntR family transcriptional regulator
MTNSADDGLRRVAQHRLVTEKLSSTVTERLRDLILSGTWAQGAQLPGEHQLAEALGVSRGTVRDALRNLSATGLIVSRRGVGTFVSQYVGMMHNNLSFNQGLTEVIEQMGLHAGCRGLSVRQECCDAYAGRALNLPEGAPVVIVERTRTANDKPVAFSVDIFASSLLPNLGSRGMDLSELQGLIAKEISLYRIFEKYFGRAPVDAMAKVKPIAATEALAGHLGVPKGTALLFLEQVDHDRDGNPLVLSFEYHVPEICTFTVYRTR